MLKLCKTTIALLKMFAKISPSIVIMPGNVVRTRNMAVYACATIPETIPQEFRIADLNNFLGIVSLFKNASLDFAVDHVRIAEEDGTAETRYAYAMPGFVMPQKAHRELEGSTEQISFCLTDAQWKSLRKALGNGALTRTPFGCSGQVYLTVKSDGHAVHINAGLKDNTPSFGYSLAVDAETNGHECEMVFSVDNLPLMAGDYAITVRPLFTEFERTDGVDLYYLVAPEPLSSWGGKRDYQVTVTKNVVQSCSVSVFAQSPEEAEAIVKEKPQEEFIWTAAPHVALDFKAR